MSANLINHLMAHTGCLNQSRLSQKVGLDRSTIKHIYDGTKTPTLRTLKQISEHTKVKVSTLAGWWAGENEV